MIDGTLEWEKGLVSPRELEQNDEIIVKRMKIMQIIFSLFSLLSSRILQFNSYSK